MATATLEPQELQTENCVATCRCSSAICACQEPGILCDCGCSFLVTGRCGKCSEPPHGQEELSPAGLEPEADPPFAEWSRLGPRGAVARLLWEGGLRSKAKRFGDCCLWGRRLGCPNEHLYFAKVRCDLRFCADCGPRLYARLYRRYAARLEAFFAGRVHSTEMVLARVTISKRASGSVPTAEEIKSFNQQVRRLFHRLNRPDSPKSYGLLFVDEFGAEKGGRMAGRKAGGLNLHVHGLYYGPFIRQEVWKSWWLDQTAGEGQGFYISVVKGWRRDPSKGVRQALAHMLKYIRKSPAISSERIAALEIAFSGVRRVHVLGLFFKLKRVEEGEGRELPKRACPKCGEQLSPVGSLVFSVEQLRSEGYQDLEFVEYQEGRRRIFGADVRGP